MVNPAENQQALDEARAAIGKAAGTSRTSVIPAAHLMAAVCDSMNCRFLVDGAPVATAAVLADETLFPAIAWVAQQNAREILAADLGYEFASDPEALLGVRASGPPVTPHIADLYRALFLQDALVTIFGVRRDTDIEVLSLAPQLREYLFSNFQASKPRQAVAAENSAPAAEPAAVAA